MAVQAQIHVAMESVPSHRRCLVLTEGFFLAQVSTSQGCSQAPSVCRMWGMEFLEQTSQVQRGRERFLFKVQLCYRRHWTHFIWKPAPSGGRQDKLHLALKMPPSPSWCEQFLHGSSSAFFIISTSEGRKDRWVPFDACGVNINHLIPEMPARAVEDVLQSNTQKRTKLP